MRFFRVVLIALCVLQAACQGLRTSNLCTGSLSQCVGQRVKIQGTLSLPGQSFVVQPEGYPETHYLHIPDQGVIVFYTQRPLQASPEDSLEVEGVVMAVGSEGKGEEFTEYQLKVDTWRKP